MEITCTVAVIGAGPAGLAAACAAKEAGAKRVIIVERDKSPGGILQQCIHPGFGLVYFKKELTGPEYGMIFIEKALELGVEFLFGTMVIALGNDGSLECVSSDKGVFRVSPGAAVLAMGCRERTRGNIRIPGTRPAGVFTAGTAQRLINRQNCMVGKRFMILGSGDIGMIMARRLSLEGAKVVAVAEIMNYISGLTRNRVQCLDDFDIPLLLSHTVTGITGNERVEGVWVSKVDESKKPVGEKVFYECDTLLLSVGLIPENELTRKAGVIIDSKTGGPAVNQWMQTSLPSVFAAGNVVHVNDLADNVSIESQIAGRYAALYATGELPETGETVNVRSGDNVRYVCPSAVTKIDSDATLYYRVLTPLSNTTTTVSCGDNILAEKKALRLNPGEMEQVTINLNDIVESDCVISVKGEI